MHPLQLLAACLLLLIAALVGGYLGAKARQAAEACGQAPASRARAVAAPVQAQGAPRAFEPGEECETGWDPGLDEYAEGHWQGRPCRKVNAVLTAPACAPWYEHLHGTWCMLRSRGRTLGAVQLPRQDGLRLPGAGTTSRPCDPLEDAPLAWLGEGRLARRRPATPPSPLSPQPPRRGRRCACASACGARTRATAACS